jgi:lipopolysaccharide export system protein LptA
VAALLAAVSAQAAEKGVPKPASPESQNTTITAEKMTVKNQENKAIFEGAVVLTKGSLIVHSDVMVVLFRPSDQPPSGVSGAGHDNGTAGGAAASDKGARPNAGALPTTGNRSVSLIEATGRVRIQKDEGRATSQKAVYFADEEKIVLTGEPVAWQKGTRVTGQKITMYLAEDRSVVEGGSHVQIEQSQGDSR